jgi:hypothetical protein
MKTYSVHGRTKGKHVFQVEPAVQVKANSPEEAEERGRQIIKNHPIMNAHYSDDVQAIENAPGGSMDRAAGDGE